MDYKQPSQFRISTYTMGGYLCKNLTDKESIIPLHVFSRLLPIITDDTSAESIKAINNKNGCYVAISDYIDNDYTDMPRGRRREDTQIYKLPSQVFNNQISLRFKYWGFRCISYKLFSNGRLQFTGIMDPKWEPVHISNQLIKTLHNLRYRVYIVDNDINTYCNQNNIDYVLIWDNKEQKVTYRRRNLEIYRFSGIMKTGINHARDSQFSHDEWLTHENATLLITEFCKPIAQEQTHLDSIMDSLRNIPEFTLDIRKHIFESENGLGRYKNITNLNIQYNRCPDIEFRRIVQRVVDKLFKTFRNYESRLQKLIATDLHIANHVNTTYRHKIISTLQRHKRHPLKTPVSALEFPTEFNKKDYCISDITTDLINSDFNTRYVNILPVISMLLKSEGIYNYYQPNNKYPGIIARFAYNPQYINPNTLNEYSPGKCYCNPRCTPGNKNGRIIPKGKCVFITINIFRTGSVMITSARSVEQIQHVYDWINSFFQKHAERVFKSMPPNHNYCLENEDRNITKKPELHYIPINLVNNAIIKK